MTKVTSRKSPSGSPTILKASVSIDLGTMPGNSPSLYVFDVPGAELGDGVVVNPTEQLPNTVFVPVHCHVLSPGKVQVIFFNINGSPETPGVQPFVVSLLRGRS